MTALWKLLLAHLSPSLSPSSFLRSLLTLLPTPTFCYLILLYLIPLLPNTFGRCLAELVSSNPRSGTAHPSPVVADALPCPTRQSALYLFTPRALGPRWFTKAPAKTIQPQQQGPLLNPVLANSQNSQREPFRQKARASDFLVVISMALGLTASHCGVPCRTLSRKSYCFIETY